MPRPIGVDLFAGAGGLSLGFEWAGFDVVAAVEIDPIHCATHEVQLSELHNHLRKRSRPIRKRHRERAKISKPIDVVFGGAPCQGFSLIGKRALDDPRNSLVFHFVRLVKELKPRYFVFENVKGLTIGKHKKFLEEIIQAFEEAGYHIKLPYSVYNAADFGVPQDRRRLFLVGSKTSSGIPGDPTTKDGVTVHDALGDLPEANEFLSLLKSDSVKAKYGAPSPYAAELRQLNERPLHFGYRREFNSDLLTSSMRTIHTEKSQKRFRATQNGTVEPSESFPQTRSDWRVQHIAGGHCE